jgi:hypothetical protein
MFGYYSGTIEATNWEKIVLMAYTSAKNPARKIKILKRYQSLIVKFMPHLAGEITEHSNELLRFPVLYI